MYYIGDCELTYRDSLIMDEILSDTISEWYDGILAIAEIIEKDTSTLNKSITISQ